MIGGAFIGFALVLAFLGAVVLMLSFNHHPAPPQNVRNKKLQRDIRRVQAAQADLDRTNR